MEAAGKWLHLLTMRLVGGPRAPYQAGLVPAVTSTCVATFARAAAATNVTAAGMVGVSEAVRQLKVAGPLTTAVAKAVGMAEVKAITALAPAPLVRHHALGEARRRTRRCHLRD
mmetsp:Transcript_39814/g.105397  ORF Transcript_39814/g.105397 Transcript_39814/m.105397 type:complete len:114 (+) Transcript_39814:783-1124(+)